MTETLLALHVAAQRRVWEVGAFGCQALSSGNRPANTLS